MYTYVLRNVEVNISGIIWKWGKEFTVSYQNKLSVNNFIGLVYKKQKIKYRGLKGSWRLRHILQFIESV